MKNENFEVKAKVKERPAGVTILMILYFISGIFAILIGAILIVYGPTLVVLIVPSLSYMSSEIADLLSVIGVAYLVTGIIPIVAGWGLLKGTSWGWWLSIALFVISALTSLLSILKGGVVSFVFIVIDVAVLYYLTRPHVREYFV